MTKGLSHWFGLSKRSARVPALGARELDVLKILWSKPALSAQQVLDRLNEQNLSLSTMQSTLERLHRKELVQREKIGRSYHYTALCSQSTMIGQMIEDIAEQISNGEMAPVISGFMEYMNRDSDSAEQSEQPSRQLQDLMTKMQALEGDKDD